MATWWRQNTKWVRGKEVVICKNLKMGKFPSRRNNAVGGNRVGKQQWLSGFSGLIPPECLLCAFVSQTSSLLLLGQSVACSSPSSCLLHLLPSKLHLVFPSPTQDNEETELMLLTYSFLDLLRNVFRKKHYEMNMGHSRSSVLCKGKRRVNAVPNVWWLYWQQNSRYSIETMKFVVKIYPMQCFGHAFKISLVMWNSSLTWPSVLVYVCGKPGNPIFVLFYKPTPVFWLYFHLKKEVLETYNQPSVSVGSISMDPTNHRPNKLMPALSVCRCSFLASMAKHYSITIVQDLYFIMYL